MTLSIVIPVRNDAEGLARLLTQIGEYGVFDAVIVCDDASDPPCRPADLGFDEVQGKITYLRNDQCQGAGQMRNRGLEAVSTDHVLFFDADDILLPPLVDLIKALSRQEEAFDFCVFRHVDSRERAVGVPGPMPWDQSRWQACGLISPDPTLLSAEERLHMAGIAAYPWNKIYRTQFLRHHQIRCTEILVHNDVELHWAGFMWAEHVLASAALCCEHIGTDGRDRLTNRSGPERLEVFQALEPLQALLPRVPLGDAFLVPLVEFYIRLFAWILSVLDRDHHARFRSLARAFLLRVHDEKSMTLIAARAPLLARDIMIYLHALPEPAAQSPHDRNRRPDARNEAR